jgi:hypothetical protein
VGLEGWVGWGYEWTGCACIVEGWSCARLEFWGFGSCLDRVCVLVQSVEKNMQGKRGVLFLSA